jgi:superfamily I DNA and RNA helicase
MASENEEFEKKLKDYGFYEIAKKCGLGINMGIYNNDLLKQLKEGFIVEFDEHGDKLVKNKEVNVVKDKKERALLIAISHLMEFPDYYTRLKELEDAADLFWKDIESTRETYSKVLNVLARVINSKLRKEENKYSKLFKRIESKIITLDKTKKKEFLDKMDKLIKDF